MKGMVILPLPPKNWRWFLVLVGMCTAVWTTLVSVVTYLVTSAFHGRLLCGVNWRQLSKGSIFWASLLPALLYIVVASVCVIKFKVGTFFTVERKKHDRWSDNKETICNLAGGSCFLCHFLISIFLMTDTIPTCNAYGEGTVLFAVWTALVPITAALLFAMTVGCSREPWKRIKLPIS
jgi:hypothetical protein